MNQQDETLQRLAASWERRAQVKRTGALDIPFHPSMVDFLPELLPARLRELHHYLGKEDSGRFLTFAWMVFNQKAIDVEHHVLLPACLRLLERASDDGDRATCDAVSQVLVDESFHIQMVRQANQRTASERNMELPRLPRSRTVTRMQRFAARCKSPWQRDLTVIGAAIVTEVFIKGYLGTLSQAEEVQPLSMLTTRAHLADEAVHASLFLALAEKIYLGLEPIQRDFLAEVLVRAMSWFPDPERETWAAALAGIRSYPEGQIAAACLAIPDPELDYAELATFLSRVGITEVEQVIRNATEEDTQ